MGGKYSQKAGRYGLSARQVRNLYERWRSGGIYKCDWDFEDFLKWAAENDYADGAKLLKYNKDLPHSPDNSFLYVSEYMRELNEKKEPEKKPEDQMVEQTWQPPEEPVKDLCEICQRECDSYLSGCADWRNNFVKYWNKHIYVGGTT